MTNKPKILSPAPSSIVQQKISHLSFKISAKHYNHNNSHLSINHGGGMLSINRGGSLLGVNEGEPILSQLNNHSSLLPYDQSKVGLGYLPDISDNRDIIFGDDEHKGITQLALHKDARSDSNLEKLYDYFDKSTSAPSETRYSLGDSNKHRFTQVEDQGPYNSCTANAVIGAVEYLLLNDLQQPEYLDLSRFFLYGRTRRILGLMGDSGAYIRATIKAMRLFGALPEEEWPYDAAHFDAEPEAYHFAYAQNFKSLAYARLDGKGRNPQELLNLLKKVFLTNFPVVFGFSVYQSINHIKSGEWIIPVPDPKDSTDKLIGGHAVMAIGYDDTVGKEGSLIIRNSWGESWGDYGYAYLPYEYIKQGLAMDFWVILHQDYAPLIDFS